MSAPVATCRVDGEPLVMTFEFPKYEFICQVCKKLYDFFGPKPADETPELLARYEELKAEYEKERAERKAQLQKEVSE